MPRRSDLWSNFGNSQASLATDPDFGRRQATAAALGVKSPDAAQDEQDAAIMRDRARVDRQATMFNMRAVAAEDKATERTRVNSLRDAGIALDRNKAPITSPGGNLLRTAGSKLAEVGTGKVYEKDPLSGKLVQTEVPAKLDRSGEKVVQDFGKGVKRDVTNEPGGTAFLEGEAEAKSQMQKAKDEVAGIENKGGAERTLNVTKQKQVHNDLTNLRGQRNALEYQIKNKKSYDGKDLSDEDVAKLQTKITDLGAKEGQRRKDLTNLISEEVDITEKFGGTREKLKDARERAGKVKDATKLAETQLHSGNPLGAAETLEGTRHFMSEHGAEEPSRPTATSMGEEVKQSKADIEKQKAEVQALHDRANAAVGPITQQIEALHQKNAAEAAASPPDKVIALQFQDGHSEPWTRENAEQRHQLEADARKAQAQSAPLLRDAQEAAERLNKNVEAHNNKVAAFNTEQETAAKESRKALASDERTKPFAAKLDALDAETKRRADQAQALPKGTQQQAALDAIHTDDDKQRNAILKDLDDSHQKDIGKVRAAQELNDLLAKRMESAVAPSKFAEENAGLANDPKGKIDKLWKRTLDRYGLTEEEGEKLAKEGYSKPYTLNSDSLPTFVPEKAEEGFRAAVKDGVITVGQAKQMEPAVKEMQKRYDDLVKAAGGEAQAKALFSGATKGAFLTAAMGVGFRGGAAVGAMIPGGGETGITELAFGTLGALGAMKVGDAAWHEGAKALGKYMDSVNSLHASNVLHPQWNEAGQIIGMAFAPKGLGDFGAIKREGAAALEPMAFSSAKNLAKTQAIAVEQGGATAGMKALGKAIGVPVVSAFAFEGVIRPAFDNAMNMLMDKVSPLKDGEKRETMPPTVESMFQNAALAMLHAGNQIRFKDYQPAEIGNIAMRGIMRNEMGIKPGDKIPREVVEKFFGAKLDDNFMASMEHPLDKAQTALFKELMFKNKELGGKGAFDVLLDKDTEFNGAKQALVPGFRGDTPFTTLDLGMRRGEGGAQVAPEEEQFAPATPGLQPGQQKLPSSEPAPPAPSEPQGPLSYPKDKGEMSTRLAAATQEQSEMPADQEAVASGLMKVALGRYLTPGGNVHNTDLREVPILTPAEARALGVQFGKGGELEPAKKPPVDEAGNPIPAMVTIVNGHPVITDEAAGMLQDVAPTTASLIGRGEGPAIEWAAGQGKKKVESEAKKEPVESKTGSDVSKTTVSDSKPAESVSPPEPKAEIAPKSSTEVPRGTKEDVPQEAKPAPPKKVEGQPPASKPVAKTSENIRARAKQAALAEAPEKASELMRQAGALADAVAKIEDKLPVKIGPAGDSGLLYDADAGAIVIDPRKVVTHMAALEAHGRTVGEEWVRQSIDHEVFHHVTVDLAAKDPEYAKDLDEVWRALPSNLKKESVQAYKRQFGKVKFASKEEAQFEFLRQLFENQEFRKLSEGYLAAHDPGLLKKLLDLIERFMKHLTDLVNGKIAPALKEPIDRLLKKSKAAFDDLKGVSGDEDPQKSAKKEGALEKTQEPAKPHEAVQAVIEELKGQGKSHNIKAIEEAATKLAEPTAAPAPPAPAPAEKPAESPKSSTQFTLTPEQAAPIHQFTASIPDSDVYRKADERGKEDYGIETEPHVTSLFGLTNHDAAQIRPVLDKFGPITLELGKVSAFTTNPDYDVLKLDVRKTPELVALNKELAGLPNENTFPDYKPHLTLAYLKKGEAKKYVGDARFRGKKITFDSLTFSPPSVERAKGNERSEHALGGKQVAAPQGVAADVDAKILKVSPDFLEKLKRAWPKQMSNAARHRLIQSIRLATGLRGSTQRLVEAMDRISAPQPLTSAPAKESLEPTTEPGGKKTAETPAQEAATPQGAVAVETDSTKRQEMKPGMLEAPAPSPPESSITAEEDRAYMNAAESDDMETAGRMVDEAAKKAGGVKVHQVVYGGKIRGDAFDPKFIGSRNGSDLSQIGYMFTSSKDAAGDYSGLLKHPVKDFYLFPKSLKESNYLNDFEARKLLSEGTDIIKWPNQKDISDRHKSDIYMVGQGHENKIKSADPITRDAQGKIIPLSERFNPHSPSILRAPAPSPPEDPDALEDHHARGIGLMTRRADALQARIGAHQTKEAFIHQQMEDPQLQAEHEADFKTGKTPTHLQWLRMDAMEQQEEAAPLIERRDRYRAAAAEHRQALEEIRNPQAEEETEEEPELTPEEAGFPDEPTAREAYEGSAMKGAGGTYEEFLAWRHCQGLTEL